MKKLDWYEKIRAESFIGKFDFMCVDKQLLTLRWAENECAKTSKQKIFFDTVLETKKLKDYYIANMEPSIDSGGRIYYKEGQEVACGLLPEVWRKKAWEFAPEYGSDIATKHQLILWYAYRISQGFWTIEEVCDNSSRLGNYWHAPTSKHHLELSAARKVAGARDGVGNTKKIVYNGGAMFCLFGGHFYSNGSWDAVADIKYINRLDSNHQYASAVITLNNKEN